MTHHDGDWAIRLRTDDPWSVALVTDLWRHPEGELPGGPGSVCADCGPACAGSEPRYAAPAADARRQAALRARGRRPARVIVLPAAAAALLWSAVYLVSAAAAQDRPALGAVRTAMTAALAQFLTASLLAWFGARCRGVRRRRCGAGERYGHAGPADRVGPGCGRAPARG